jgi:hypothetical protein
MALEGDGQEWAEDGEVLADGPTDMGLGGGGAAVIGVVLALVLGALITKVVSAINNLKNKVKAFNIGCSKP